MKPVRTWILVADGAHARIACNLGPGKGIEQPLEAEFDGEARPTREIQADRPGRSFDSGGEGRHAMEPRTDPHQHEKAVFVHDVADYVNAAAQKGRFDRLVLVAPPRVLGELREYLSDAAKANVKGELHKDLTKTPLHELPTHLGEVMAI